MKLLNTLSFHYKAYRITLLFIFLISSVLTFGQVPIGGSPIGGGGNAPYITGPSTVNQNVTNIYTIQNFPSGSFASWSVSGGGEIVSSSGNTANIRWSSAGSKTVSASLLSLFGSNIAQGISVNVILGAPSKPSNPTLQSNNCGNSVIRRGTPPSGVTWYWQGKNSAGTSTANSNTTYTATSSGRYYLRARNSSGWSSTSSSIYLTIRSVPGTPSTPSVSNQCGQSVLTRGNPPSGVTWYWQSSSSGTSTGNSNTSITRTSGSKYYLRARNNSSGCWSSVRTVNYSIKTKPSTPSAPTVSNQCGQSVLTRGNPPSGVTWYWQSSSGGTSTGNSSASITRTSGSVYYLRARHNSSGCWSSSRTVSYARKSKPGTPASPTVSNQCGQSVLTRTNPPSGVTWYWQSSSSGTSTGNSNTSITRTSGSVYYLRARNNSTHCWSSARTVSYAIKAKPSTPSTISVSQNCGNTVLTRNIPPSGVTWYWQSSSGGTSTSNSSSTITRTSGTVYYLRARHNSSGCWSSSRSVSYSVKSVPSTPGTVNVSNNCGSSVLTRANPPSGVTWYWQSSAFGTSTGNSSSSISRTSGSTYYLRARNNSSLCWSPARTVHYTVKSVPAQPPTVSVSNQCGQSVLTRTGLVPPGETWYWQSSSGGTNTGNSSASITRTSGSTYYLRARNNLSHCWGPARSVSYSRKPKPNTPSTPTVSSNSCGNKTLTRVNPPSGEAWYWQGTNSGGTSTSNSSGTYTVSSSGTYYLRARGVNGCWGNAIGVSVTVTSKPPQPIVNSISNNCGNSVIYFGSKPSNVTWYWQGINSNGTSTGTSIGSNSSKTVNGSSPAGYYVRARNNSSGCWSDNRVILVSPKSIPSVPPVPQITENCGNTVLSRGTVPSGETWYWSTSASGTPSDVSAGTYTVTSGGTYYLRTVNSQGCSNYRAISVSVRNKPSTPPVPLVATGCGSSTISRNGNPPSGVTWYWQGTNSSGTNTSNSSANYTVSSAGTYYLRARSSNGCWSTNSISVPVSVNALPATPGEPAVSSNSCGSKTLSRIASLPSGVSWYWQGTNANGTDVSNSSTSYSVSTSGTYYVRARNNSTQCWSAGSRSISVTIHQMPSSPSTPTVSAGCGTSTISRVGAVPSGTTWYWQTSESGTNTSSSASTYEVTNLGTYYIRPRSSAGCWGASTAVEVAINTVPATPSIPSKNRSCGSGVLTRANPPSGQTWYWQSSATGVSVSNSASTYSYTAPGTIYLRSRSSSGCWGPALRVDYNVDRVPNAPEIKTALDYTLDGPRLERETPQGGDTWYWQGINSNGTSQANSGQYFPANEDGTYYLRAKSSDGCWGPEVSKSIIITETPEADITYVSKNSARVSWTGAGDETAFNIYRSTQSGSGYALVGSAAGGDGSYLDEGLAEGTTYYYRVQADKNGELSASNVISVTTKQDIAPEVTQDFNAQYNGNISAIKWKTLHDGAEQLYTYEYDAMNRLKAAMYSKGSTTAGNWTATAHQGGFSVNNISYDLNGNIKTLNRQMLNQDVQTIDALTYGYNGNRLQSVNDQADDEGFKDGNISGDDYTYDPNGNMIQDLNKGITSITYNHLNLPQVVTKDDGTTVRYTYDAAGIKLAKEVTKEGTTTTTDYVGNFVYENDTLQFLLHEEGRALPIIANGSEAISGWDYEFFLKDHLGNTRVTIGKPETFTYLATMETENATAEEALFMNIPGTRVAMANANNTPGGNEAARVNNVNPVGPLLALNVNPGDTIDLETYAYYDPGTQAGNPLASASLIAALVGSFDASVIGPEGVTQLEQGFNQAIGTGGLAGESNSTAPAGYLNYMLFDEDLNFYRGGFVQISTGAEGAKEYLSLTDIIPEKVGYLFAYVSNESDITSYVHFDDLQVTHTTSGVNQVNDYYPFGLTFNSYERTASTPNRYKYNGMEEQEEWYVYDYGARYYDPAIARFINVDPAVDNYYSWTPYHYVMNNPILFVDPTGAFTEYFNENGQLVYDDGVDNGELRLIEQETFDQLNNGTDIESADGDQLLRGSSREITVDNDQIQSDLQTARDNSLETGVEHSVEIVLDPSTATVTSRLGAIGDNNSVELNYIPDEGSVFEEQGALPLLGQAHGHPKTTEAGKVNTPGTSDDDKTTASGIQGPIYAIDSYSGKAGKSGRIHRVDSDGIRTNNVGRTIGDGRKKGAGQFNLGKDALRRSGRARKRTP